VTSIDITATRGDWLGPPPEGDRYLGFVFATADRPEVVGSTLIKARGLLAVQMSVTESAKVQ
jgi:hypothetical protein